jgi:hypothetical protein
LRPLGVAEILDGAVRLVRRNARAVLTVSVPFAFVRAGLGALLQYGAIESKDAVTIIGGGGLLLAAGLGLMLTGLLAPLFSSDLLGAPVSARDSLGRVGRSAWPLLGLGLIVIIAEGAGLAACLVGGVWLWGIWAVAGPALVLERTGVGAALGRSRRLVEGTFWRTWGIRALGWAMTTLLSLIVVVPAEVIAGLIKHGNPLDTTHGVSQAGLFVTILAIGSLLSAALLDPVSSAIDVLLYTDLRMRREGMDITLALPAAPATAREPRPPISAW